MQNLGRAMRRINIMGMHRSKIAGEFVQCVVVKLLNCDPSAGGITFTENFRKIAAEQRLYSAHICAHRRRDGFLTGTLAHHRAPCMRDRDAGVGANRLCRRCLRHRRQSRHQMGKAINEIRQELSGALVGNISVLVKSRKLRRRVGSCRGQSLPNADAAAPRRCRSRRAMCR